MSKLGQFAAVCAVVVCALVFASSSAWAMDYTWTGGAEGDGQNWYNPTNWGKTAVNDYPKSTSDKAIFPANADVTVVITNDIKVYQVNFNAGCSFTLKGEAANGVVPQLNSNNNFSDSGIVKLKLDGAYFYRDGGWTPKAGCSFELTNGAKLYLGDFYLTTMDSVSLSGGSWMSVNQFFINGKTRTLTIDDSTFEARSSATLGRTNPGGGHIVFKGAHPIFRLLAGECRSNNSGSMTDMFDFDFEVPAGGFEEIPVQLYGNMLGYGQGNQPAGYYRFNVLEGSAAAGSDLDFCALFSAKGIYRTKVSTVTETVATLRTTDDTAGAPASDGAARMLWLKFAGENPATAAVHPAAIALTSLATVNRHQIAVRGWVTALPTDGDTIQLELWAGEANNVATMTLADSCELTALGGAELAFTAPEDIGEKTYYLQLRLGGSVTPVVSAATKDTTVYTWKAKDGDWTGAWNDPDHWETQFATVDGYPHTANATAKFPRGEEIAVTINDNYTVGTVDFTDYNPDDVADAIDVTFVGAEGEEYGTNKVLTVSTLSINAFGGQVELDRAAVKVSNGFSLGAKRTLLLKNGAWFYCNNGLTSQSGGTFAVTDGSYASLGSMQQENKGSTLIIDNATLNMRGSLTHATANVTSNGGEVYFRGANAAMIFDAGQCINHRANGPYTMVYTFEVPKGGYAVAPIRAKSASVNFPQYYGANFLKFEIDPKSPCFDEVATFDTPIVDWRNGSQVILSTGKNIFGELPDDGSFAYGTTTEGDWGWTDVPGFSGTAKSIGAHIVSVAHNDRLTVTGDVTDAVEGAEPAFGESSIAEKMAGGKVYLSSPETFEANGARYTCTGCTLTEIEKTAEGSVLTPHEFTGCSFAFDVSGKELSAVWHYTVDYKVTVAAVNDANGTVEASNNGYVSAAAPVTLTASTTSEDMEFQYWYGDLPYAERYTNPLTLSGDKARNVTAFFGRKMGGVCTTSGSNGTVQWYDANQWAGKVIPGTNDTAVLWCTRDDTHVAQYKRRYMVPNFFAVGNLVISNACVLVNTKDTSAAGNGVNARMTDMNYGYCFCAPLVNDAARLEPVGCDIYGDVTVTCRNAKMTNNGGILAVGGQGGQAYTKVTIMGDLVIEDGAVQVSAGYPIPALIDATKAIDGPNGFLPFTHPEEMFRGGNVLRVLGKTTVETPKSKESPSTLHTINEFRSGAAVWLDLQEVEVQAGGSITAHQGGYGMFNSAGEADSRSYSMCPGGHGTGDNTSGGSYGGAGGTEELVYPAMKATSHIATYGYATAPYHPGSPNSGTPGCGMRGAGSIRLDCTKLDLEGALLAQGLPASGNKGGSAGGGIWVVCETLTAGTDAKVFAQGGSATGANSGGGGGRIAICEGLTVEQVLELFESDDHLATDATVSSLADKLGARFSAAGGTGTSQRSNGYDGTGVYIVNTAGKKTMTVMGDPVNMGEPTPGYGPQVFEQNQEIALAGPEDVYVSDDNRSRRNCVGYTITDLNGGVLVDSDERTGSYKITQDCTLTWKLTTLVHKLETVVSEGGSITTNAISVADDAWQPDGSTITLTAVPAAGRAFAGWYGELPTNLQAAATLSFPSAKGRTVKALFVTTAEGPAVWTGAGDGTSWDDAANWDIGAVPGPNSDVVLTNTANVVAAMCVPVCVKSLTVDAGATLKLTPDGAYSTYSEPQVAEKSVETDWQPIALRVAGDLTVNGTFEIGGKFSLATFELTVGGALTFGEDARGTLYAAYRASEEFFANPQSRYDTNETSMAEAALYVDGGRVTVGGELLIATNAVVATWCDFLSGASVRFDVGSLRVAAGGKIDADGKGWGYTVHSDVAYAFSPTLRDGGTGGYAGGTYAGVGGYSDYHSPSFNVYGWALAPLLPGGPGFNTSAAPGGGVVRIHATGTIRCYGTITAVGGTGSGYHGAGGGIFLTGSRFKSADTTVVSAAGHDNTTSGNSGAGAGGRVAICEHLNAAQLAELYQSGSLTGANAKDITIDVLDGPDAPISRHMQGLLTARGGVNDRTFIADRRYRGEDGTVRWIQGSKPGLRLIVR